MSLTRRQFILAAAMAAGSPVLVYGKPQALSGSLIGLTTLNGQGKEVSEFFQLDLETGAATFGSLGGYRFGHSLEPLAGNQWLAVPYGDDSQACLVIDKSGNLISEFAAPTGYGFGGHALVMASGEQVFLHYNQSDRDPDGKGRAQMIDVRSGAIEASVNTPLIHAHDMLINASGLIVIADDGVIDSNDETAPYLLEPVSPALYFFDKNLNLTKTVELPINGSLVHIAENHSRAIIGAVEQYVRLNDSGRHALKEMFGSSTASFLDQFDPEIFDLDVPLPGAIVTVAEDNRILQDRSQAQHLDPFDALFNTATQTTCCVFTETNLIAWQKPGTPWHYLKLDQFSLKSPFGLASLGKSTLIAVNGFDQGVAVLDTTDMSLVQFFDVPTQGVKHLSYAPV